MLIEEPQWNFYAQKKTSFNSSFFICVITQIGEIIFYPNISFSFSV